MQQFKLTVSTKGQVTLPAEVREKLGIETGTKLTLLLDDAGTVRIKKTKTLADIAGSMAHIGRALQRPITQDDIDDAITQAMEEKEARSKWRPEK
jgi:AbrB family looped-hinge helix DNA binding protein